MLPTPSTSHISFDRVYEPAEDSFLLLDTLSSPAEKAFLKSQFPKTGTGSDASPIVLEVGVGSGVVLAFVTAHARQLFGRWDILTLGTDINSFACRGAIQTALLARKGNCETSALFGDVLNADLATSIRPGLVDVLIFNPPYVPTELLPSLEDHDEYNNRSDLPKSKLFDRDSHLLALSYAGGADGMEITDRLLNDLPRLLRPSRGVAYILMCAQNKPAAVIQRVKEQLGLSGTVVGSSGMKAGWEKLCIVRFSVE